MLQLRVKRLDDRAVIPVRATEGSAGWDITTIDMGYNYTQGRLNYIEYSTGLAVEIPKGFMGLLVPRSSISLRCLEFANGVGIIDSDYRGELKIRVRPAGALVSHTDEIPFYEVGERIAQLVIVPYLEITEIVELAELSGTKRGEGGFGSTDKVVNEENNK